MNFQFFNKKITNVSFAKKSILIVVLFTIVRLILSSSLQLGNDENYYWTYSQHLQWNYFDHPPLVAVWIRFFTGNLFFEDTFFLRLGSLVSCAISSYFIYKIIKTLHTERAAFIGVFLYNTSFYACITAGLFIMPDSPQMVFWTAAMYFATKILEDKATWKYWLLFGVAAGLSIMSKVHAVFLWQGMLLYALFYKRSWFSTPAFYIAGLVTLIIVTPIIIWNINNDFITYRFHSERVTVDTNTILNWLGLLKECIGQIVVNNPFNVAFIIVFFRIKKYVFNDYAFGSLMLFKLISIPLWIIILVIALLRTSLPHWSGPVYVTLIPMAAIGIASIKISSCMRLLKFSTAYFLIFIMLIITAVVFYPGTFGSVNEDNLGKGDISLDAYGWKEAGEKFAILYNEKHVYKPVEDKPPLVCNNWWGAHEEYFFARPLKIKMIGLGSIDQLHHYTWKNKIALPITNMDTAYCIVHSDEYYDARQTYKAYYNSIDSITTIKILRNKKPAHNFYVYQLIGFKK